MIRPSPLPNAPIGLLVSLVVFTIKLLRTSIRRAVGALVVRVRVQSGSRFGYRMERVQAAILLLPSVSTLTGVVCCLILFR
jgi:hypothetical protein